MPFRFDKQRAQKPLRVSWRLSAATVAEVERIAQQEGVKPEEVAQQALDHALAGRGRKTPGEAAPQVSERTGDRAET
jgi:hypothetical protein